MGLGDEIMAAGRAERLFHETGKQVAICRIDSPSPGVPVYPRDHPAWQGHPGINPKAPQRIIDCAASRPYIRAWHGRKVEFNLDHRPYAGRIHLTPEEWEFNPVAAGPYAVVSPYLKPEASPNKSWGVARWEAAIKDFPIPVYQLGNESDPLIKGAQRIITPTFRHAVAVIARAAVVLTNEGGAHHMAAAMRVPAVVFFGSFTPPLVTGYPFHYNMGVDTPEGYCGRWDECAHCNQARGQITVEAVREKALLMVDAYAAD